MRSFQLESLESRRMLSAAASTVAWPVHHSPKGPHRLQPLTTASPNGYTPSQLRHAYGLDNILINGVPADGTGQTIAIVDAYDNPKFVSSSLAGYATSDLFKF